jgi:SAM-dependent methyltransferase
MRIHLKHLRHPIRSARSLHALTLRAGYKWLSDRQDRKIPRGHLEACWCGGTLRPMSSFPSYGTCLKCGCYVNRRPPLPVALEDLYSFQYWKLRQKAMGHPPIEKRGDLYRVDGRLDYWLSLVHRFGPKTGTVIEVGCAPGTLLSELKKESFQCLGVEPNEETAKWLRREAKIDVREGLFPDVELPPCDLFLSFDVAEHTPEPLAFWKKIAAVLRPEGVAIIQTAIEHTDYDQPFKSRPDFFNDVEHLYLYTDKSVMKLTYLADLELIALEDAIGTLGQICVLKKQRLTRESN